MVNVKKIVNTRVSHLVNSNKDFEAIHNGMFLSQSRVLRGRCLARSRSQGILFPQKVGIIW